MAPGSAPICAWLTMGPQSQATVSVSFVGTYKQFSLTRVQARKLHAALAEAIDLMARDSGDSQHRVVHKLAEGIDA